MKCHKLIRFIRTTYPVNNPKERVTELSPNINNRHDALNWDFQASEMEFPRQDTRDPALCQLVLMFLSCFW